jgi:hypothetical protein
MKKQVEPNPYSYDTRKQEAKIMRALVAAGEAGLPQWRIHRLTGPGWRTERALKRLRIFEKARHDGSTWPPDMVCARRRRHDGTWPRP